MRYDTKCFKKMTGKQDLTLEEAYRLEKVSKEILHRSTSGRRIITYLLVKANLYTMSLEEE